ncbi:DUF1304 domain-containing protein [Microterricola viridarii]|uniref:Epimerase n=1 Tax=Microterricola viridarii TaxID=412690 RepID=A0A0Y0PBI8_9MICO|nr:DUF1304 domain-containing protein [Microterricola viridarii]AMB59902.1 hypothetical protein AWU67_14705 [Microterricola viridarii]
MLALSLILLAIAALIHVYIFVLESLRWTAPATRRTFGTSEADAATTRQLAFNQGFYNLFLAIIVAVGIGFASSGALAPGAALLFAGAGSMVAAGLVLLASDRRLLRAALVQLAAPLIGLVLLLIALLA